MLSLTKINDEVMLKKGFTISTDKLLLDVAMIHHFLSVESYWAKEISFERVQNSIEHSICFGVYANGLQVGFARVITDQTTFAYLADVFIKKDYQKQGLSKWLVQTILAHPNLQGLRRWLLATADAHGLYKQFGFTALDKPDRFMQKVKKTT